MKAIRELGGKSTVVIGKTEMEKWDYEQGCRILEEINKLLSNLTKFINAIANLGRSVGDRIIRDETSRMDKRLTQIGEVLIHRYMLTSLKRLGLDNSWLKLVYDKDGSGIWLQNLEGVYVVINQRMFNSMGLSDHTDVLGQTNADIIERGKIAEEVIPLLKMFDIRDVDTELDVKTTTDEELDISLTQFTIRGHENEPIAVFGIVTQIGESSREAKLAHDLKTMLGT